MPRPPRAFLFDIGNVLVTFDFGRFEARLRDRCGRFGAAEAGEFEAMKVALERGEVAGDAFVARAIELFEFRGDPAEFRAIWNDIFAANAAMEPVLARLRGRVPLYLFSNTSDLHHAFLVEEFGVFGHFDGGIFSYRARSMKPDDAIYRAAVDELGIDPAETIYIDDLPANIAAGKRHGFRAIQYDHRDHAALECALERALGVI